MFRGMLGTMLYVSSAMTIHTNIINASFYPTVKNTGTNTRALGLCRHFMRFLQYKTVVSSHVVLQKTKIKQAKA